MYSATKRPFIEIPAGVPQTVVVSPAFQVFDQPLPASQVCVPATTVPLPVSPSYCPVCNVGMDSIFIAQHIRDEHTEQSQQISAHEEQRMYDCEDAHSDESVNEDPIHEPDFDVASDEVRTARGLVFAAPQVEWADQYVRRIPDYTPIFNVRETRDALLPSGVPSKYKYSDRELLYLSGNMDLALHIDDDDMEENVARRPRYKSRPKQRIAKKKDNEKGLIEQARLHVDEAIQMSSSGATFQRRVTAITQSVHQIAPDNVRTEAPQLKSQYLDEYINKLRSENKIKMGDLTPEDLEQIRNDKQLPSGFRHSILRAFSSSKVNEQQLIYEFKNYLMLKKNSKKTKSSTSISSSSI